MSPSSARPEGAGEITTGVFIHGLFSSPATFAPLIADLKRLNNGRLPLRFVTFGYDSPKFRLDPRKRVPDLFDVADGLASFLKTNSELREHQRIVLVGHSFGALAIQAMLVKWLHDNDQESLARIRRVVLVACPNNGSQLLLTVRRFLDRFFLWRHSQEAWLRPMNERLQQLRRDLLCQVVFGEWMSSGRHQIPFDVMAGASDGIVPPTSACDYFPLAATIAGDHFSILDPRLKESQITDRVLLALSKAHSSVASVPTFIQVESLDATAVTDLIAAIKLQHERFDSDAHVRLEELRSCLATYETRFGFRPQLWVAKLNGVVAAMMLFSETSAALVVGLLGTSRRSESFLLTDVLIRDLIKRSRDLGDKPIVFDVRDPLDDPHNARRHRARIKFFERLGGRMISRVQILAPDMGDLGSAGREKKYHLMYFKFGCVKRSLHRDEVAKYIQAMFKAFYHCWFSESCADDLGYLAALESRVIQALPSGDIDLGPLRRSRH